MYPEGWLTLGLFVRTAAPDAPPRGLLEWLPEECPDGPREEPEEKERKDPEEEEEREEEKEDRDDDECDECDEDEWEEEL